MIRQFAMGSVRSLARVNDLAGRAGVLNGPLAELRNESSQLWSIPSGDCIRLGVSELLNISIRFCGGLGQTPDELLGKLNSNHATSGFGDSRCSAAISWSERASAAYSESPILG